MLNTFEYSSRVHLEETEVMVVSQNENRQAPISVTISNFPSRSRDELFKFNVGVATCCNESLSKSFVTVHQQETFCHPETTVESNTSPNATLFQPIKPAEPFGTTQHCDMSICRRCRGDVQIGSTRFNVALHNVPELHRPLSLFEESYSLNPLYHNSMKRRKGILQ